MKLSKHCRFIDRALNYFQNIDIRELVCIVENLKKQTKFLFLFQDLSESLFETFDLKKPIHIYSLRSLCISTDHPLELFTLLFQIAPFLQHIKLISSLKLQTNNQLYDCIHFVISQCQQRLKCLCRLHIQLRSISDQVIKFFSISYTVKPPIVDTSV